MSRANGRLAELLAKILLERPDVGAGVLVTPLGLEATFESFGSVVAALALAVAFEAWRTRPVPRLAYEVA